VFDVGAAWGAFTELRDARVLLEDGEVSPGSSAAATLEPLRPEYWDHLRAGVTLPMLEGTRVVGHVEISERSWPRELSTVVASFVRAAYAFCELVQQASSLPLAERARLTREHLLRLYGAATDLPSLEPSEEHDAPSFPAPEGWAGFEEHDSYWEVFDPYQHAAPVCPSLSDDVLDVYLELRRGLWFWEKNMIADAVWEWRFSFESHWGDHAIDALRALHRVCKK